jgi:hypothetical protein
MKPDTEELLQKFLIAGVRYFASFESDAHLEPTPTDAEVEDEEVPAAQADVVPVVPPAGVTLLTGAEVARLVVEAVPKAVDVPAPQVTPERPVPEPGSQADLVKRSVDKLHLRLLQDRLVKIIDDNEAALAKSIEQLGCGGDCYQCPMPEFEKVEDQVFNCLKAVVEGLQLDKSLLEWDISGQTK